MNYNELTYYHANPFYKQDFLPNRAWHNREARTFPSEMPSGKDFSNDGRKHFQNKFNHSEIQEENILKSPERYVFENRIAMDKTFMRSLQTIDIEGASSNTRVNQSIKNKYKARDELARRYNQSVELKEKTEEQKRREVALKHYLSSQQRSQREDDMAGRMSRVSKVSNNPEKESRPMLKKDISEEYKRYIMQNSSNKFSKDIPKADYPAHLMMDQNEYSNKVGKTIDNSCGYQVDGGRREDQGGRIVSEQSVNNSSQLKNNSANRSQLKKGEQYQRILKYEELNRRMLQNPKDLRKNNPTNLSLSFSLAGQTIISS